MSLIKKCWVGNSENVYLGDVRGHGGRGAWGISNEYKFINIFLHGQYICHKL